ncbi:hypothetical protein CEE36_02570 [candidate division TA06 bacterium B3_TA06]|uniref:Uncharacterized protein n=1 Tax=candidate division TA06 bacterium B3_TA06 TaxID=2012487 RepID=A0A532VA45_UNCT6|nr:MAG: hypothetical protein CEE36_02570 [candidate division TA06 bacterium B3_TA06]
MGFIDWLYDWARLIGAVGGLIGGIGALIAVFFLWRNLVQMKKQLREMREQKVSRRGGLLSPP